MRPEFKDAFVVRSYSCQQVLIDRMLITQPSTVRVLGESRRNEICPVRVTLILLYNSSLFNSFINAQFICIYNFCNELIKNITVHSYRYLYKRKWFWPNGMACLSYVKLQRETTRHPCLDNRYEGHDWNMSEELLPWSTFFRSISLRKFVGVYSNLRFWHVRKIAKASTSFIMSVRVSAWNNSASTGRIFIKFYIWWFFENLSRKFEFH